MEQSKFGGSERLVDSRGKVEARNEWGNTPLHAAAAHGKLARVSALLKAGATLEARDKEGRTPLHQAAAFNAESAVVLTLLDAGADPKAKNTDGKTVFDLIRENGKLKDTDAYWRMNDLQYE